MLMTILSSVMLSLFLKLRKTQKTAFNKMLDWFNVKQMRINDDKFQYIVFSKHQTINDE